MSTTTAPQDQASKSFMLLLRGGKEMDEMTPEEAQQCLQRYFSWMDQLKSRGQFKSGEPLERTGKVLAGKGGHMVTDGPYVEGKEEVGGFFMIQARDLKEAAEIARGCPIFENDGIVEVREIQVIPGM